MFEIYRDDLRAALLTIDPEQVKEVIRVLRRVKENGSTVYILGNGGSSSTASHFANDLVKMAGIRAFALSDSAAIITAYGNDTGWENMFGGPLRILLLPDDVIVFISCSGNSPNVVEAMKFVKTVRLPGLRTVVLTGLREKNQLVEAQPAALVCVAFADIRVQEDCHLAVCHAIARELAHAASPSH